MMRLIGKVVLITADDRRFYNAVALAFAREGASVIVAGPEPKTLEATARAIEEMGGECLSLVLDPLNAESCEQGIAKIAAIYYMDGSRHVRRGSKRR